ncbi:MAG: hypothetical protein Q8R48_01845, partial [Candidatus Omnitrophota bacterium]|nr:hypothetical protein [Candidatus Omnitrophota bacterium]
MTNGKFAGNLAACTSIGSILIIDPETGAPVKSFGFSGIRDPLCMAVLPDGKIAVCDEFDSSLNIIDLETEKVISKFTGIGIGIPQGMAVLPDGDVAICNLQDHKIVIVNPEDGKVNRELDPMMLSSPMGISVMPDGNLIISMLDHNSSLVMLNERKRIVDFMHGHGIDGASNVALLPGGKYLVCSTRNSSLIVLDPENPDEDKTVAVFKDLGLKYPRGMAVLPDGNLAVFNRGSAQPITIVEFEAADTDEYDYTRIESVKEHSSHNPFGIVFLATGKYAGDIAVADWFLGELSVLDPDSGEKKNAYNLITSTAAGIAQLDDGTLVVCDWRYNSLNILPAEGGAGKRFQLKGMTHPWGIVAL